MFNTSQQSQDFEPGEVPIANELYLATKNYNPDIKEPTISSENIRLLGYRAGEIVIVTLTPNRGGWLEGYRANDPDRLCGLAHSSSFRKINFT